MQDDERKVDARAKIRRYAPSARLQPRLNRAVVAQARASTSPKWCIDLRKRQRNDRIGCAENAAINRSIDCSLFREPPRASMGSLSWSLSASLSGNSIPGSLYGSFYGSVIAMLGIPRPPPMLLQLPALLGRKFVEPLTHLAPLFRRQMLEVMKPAPNALPFRRRQHLELLVPAPKFAALRGIQRLPMLESPLRLFALLRRQSQPVLRASGEDALTSHRQLVPLRLILRQ
jgi:hypothetical protein